MTGNLEAQLRQAGNPVDMRAVIHEHLPGVRMDRAACARDLQRRGDEALP